MEQFLVVALANIWQILSDAAPYLLLGFWLAGALHRFVTAARIEAIIGAPTARSVLWAALIGAPLPLCSCGTLPVAISARRQGASRGATLSFLISTPETDVSSILFTFALFDPLMALFRPVSAIITAIVAGLTANALDRWHPEHQPATARPTEDPQCGCHDECSRRDGHADAHNGHHHAPAAPKRKGILQYAFRELFDDISWWLTLSLVIAGVILTVVPDEAFSGDVGGGFLGMLLMLLLGIPLYMCATSSTPIAAALMLKGLSPGAALVLLLSGPATNAATIMLIGRFLGKRVLIIYLATIAVCSISLGLLLNRIYQWFELAPKAALAEAAFHLPNWLTVACSLVLIGLLGQSYLRVGWPPTIRLLRNRIARVTGGPVADRLLIAAAIACAVGLYAFSGWFIVGPSDTGVVRVFGAVLPAPRPPGLHWRWPWPAGQHHTIDTAQIQRLVIGFPADHDSGPGILLTGDENLADLRITVHYRAADAAAFLTAAETPEKLLRCAAQSCINLISVRQTIDALLTEDRRAVEQSSLECLQQSAEVNSSGIEVLAVWIIDAHAPADVHDAFRDVASADEDRSATIYLAQVDALRRKASARSEAMTAVENAKASAVEDSTRANGESLRFLSQWQAWQAAPEINRQRLYLESMERSLRGAELVIVPPDIDGIDLDIIRSDWELGARPSTATLPADGALPLDKLFALPSTVPPDRQNLLLAPKEK